MRLHACIGALSLFAVGCSGLPERVRIDVDGRIIELRQHGFGNEKVSGRWSTSPDCSGAAELLPQEIARVRSIAPDELELASAGGAGQRLYRCPE